MNFGSTITSDVAGNVRAFFKRLIMFLIEYQRPLSCIEPEAM